MTSCQFALVVTRLIGVALVFWVTLSAVIALIASAGSHAPATSYGALAISTLAVTGIGALVIAGSRPLSRWLTRE